MGRGRRHRRRLGCISLGISLERFRKPEIKHLHRAVFFDLDVRRFQIAVDDAGLVGRLEGVRDLPRDSDSFVEWDRPLGDAFGKRRALDELQDPLDTLPWPG